MSSNLYWEFVDPPKNHILPDELKHKLRELKNLENGVLINELDRDWLEALFSCGIKGANEVLNLIDKFGSIKLVERW